MIRKRLISGLLLVCLMCSFSITAFAAAEDNRCTKTATYNGNTLTGNLMYFTGAVSVVRIDDGELELYGTWTGDEVNVMYMEVETVDYYTGETVSNLSMSQTYYNTNSDSLHRFCGASDKVTIYGLVEIRDSFSLLVRPYLIGTDGTM